MSQTSSLKLLASSQYFGFGPTSNLFTILKELKVKIEKIEITLIQNQAIEVFARKNENIANRLIVTPKYNSYDLILSAFDPLVVLNGWLSGIKTFYICNLLWFWRPKNIEFIQDHIKHLSFLKESNKYRSAIRYFKKICKDDFHMAIVIAYVLATHCFIRKIPNIKERLCELKIKCMVNYTECNIIIPHIFNRSAVDKDIIYFQLSGSKNPLCTDVDHKNYLKLMYDYILYLSNEFPNLRFVFCVNPYFIRKNNWLKGRRNVEIITTISQSDHIKFLHKAIGLFTSPGLEVIYEAIYCETPIFLLPEQSAGQYENFYFLRKHGFEPDRFLIDEECCKRMRVSGEEDIKHIYREISRIVRDGNTNILYKRGIRFIKKIFNERIQSRYLSMQKNSVIHYLGERPFSQGDVIANKILQIL